MVTFLSKVLSELRRRLSALARMMNKNGKPDTEKIVCEQILDGDSE